MDLSNLHVGDIIKNYRCLCDILKEPIFSGNSKKYQLNRFNTYFKWERCGQKYIIIEIYDAQIKKSHKLNHLGHYRVGDNTYCVNKKLNQCKGVYIIQLKSDVYIGSTIQGFRHRYTQHYQNSLGLMPHTQYMLLSGGKFSILWIAANDSTENDIREKEQYYINQYDKDPYYNLINRNTKVDIPKYRSKKLHERNRRLIIKEKDYSKLLRLCKENNIEITQ